MKATHWRSGSVLLASWGVTLLAAAQPGLVVELERLDADGDGAVTALELEVGALKRWAEHDLDGDGKVTLTELEPRFATRSGQRLAQHLPGDANRDGAISKEEALASARLLLRHLDVDGDGVIDADELALRRQVHGRGPIL